MSSVNLSGQHLQRPRPEESLLLVIDVQERLLPVIADSDAIVERHCELLGGAKVLGVKTIFSEQYPKGLGSTVTTLWSWIEESDRNVYSKVAFSFVDAYPELLEEFRAAGIRHVILTGVEAHICVYQTARDLLALGFAVTVVSDCVGSREHSDRDAALLELRRIGVRVLSSEALLFDLLREAGTEAFKQISMLIK
ncbi:MAG: isochorismatase family protein [Eubacteriales bacterium]|nr:isochorismatase family protein [Eubacteriales bacterium]